MLKIWTKCYRAWVAMLLILFTASHANTPTAELDIRLLNTDPKLNLRPEQVLALNTFTEESALRQHPSGTKWLVVSWDKMTVLNSRKTLLINDYTGFGYVNYYPIQSGRLVDVWLGGHEQRVDRRPNPDYHKFYVDISRYDAMLIRIGGHASLPIMLRLISEAELQDMQTFELAWYAVIFAIIGVMVIYNLFIFLYLRERQYVYYCIYLLAQLFTLIRLSGLGKQYLWPGVTQYSSHINVFSTMIITVTGVLFMRAFLTETYLSKGKHRLMLALVWLSVFFFVGYLFTTSFVSGTNMLFVFGGLAMVPISLLVVYYVLFANYRQGDQRASVLIITYTILNIGSYIALFRYFGLLPHSLWSLHALDVAVALEAIILSLALAQKIDILRKAKVQAERDNVELQRHFSQQLLSVQELEKQELGRTLHDDFTHRLLVIKNNLVQKLGKNDAEVKNVTDCLDEIRHLSHRIHPYVVDRLGLKPALIDLCSQSRKSSQAIEINYLIEDLTLSHEQSILIYRIVQESLSNILKHANATEVLVALRKTENNASLVIDDDGSGFDVDNTDGFGLSSIKARVQMLAGTLTLQSNSHGTNCQIDFPIRVDA